MVALGERLLTLCWTLDIAAFAAPALEGAVWVVILVVPHDGNAMRAVSGCGLAGSGERYRGLSCCSGQVGCSKDVQGSVAIYTILAE
jgi:hypothetical protein